MRKTLIGGGVFIAMRDDDAGGQDRIYGSRHTLVRLTSMSSSSRVVGTW
jgi:hypothetical protein